METLPISVIQGDAVGMEVLLQPPDDLAEGGGV